MTWPTSTKRQHVNVKNITMLQPLKGSQINAVFSSVQVHPGYGFLSENKEFAKRLVSNKQGYFFSSPFFFYFILLNFGEVENKQGKIV